MLFGGTSGKKRNFKVEIFIENKKDESYMKTIVFCQFVGVKV